MNCENEKLVCGLYILYIVISVDKTICWMKETQLLHKYETCNKEQTPTIPKGRSDGEE